MPIIWAQEPGAEKGLTRSHSNVVWCFLPPGHEKLCEKDKALGYYRKASMAVSHNPPAAYSVPFAKKRRS